MQIKYKFSDFILQLGVIIVATLFFAVSQNAVAQDTPAGFVENFSSPQLTGWNIVTGSGDLIANQTVTLTQKNGTGFFCIDATKDRRNIWWAVMNHEITEHIDRSMLGKPDKAIRIEAKVRLPKPRRFNMSLNHTSTTNYHNDLAEFDIDDSDWHVVSYTNREFGAQPADRVFVQLAVMDAGREVITVELEYIKVTIVDAATAAPDLDHPIPYRPLLEPPENFTHSLIVKEDAIIDSEYPWVNFSKWYDASTDSEPLLSVSGSQTSILRWDFSGFAGKKTKGWGLLVLTTHSVLYAPSDLEEFGYLRLVEIKDGDPSWTRNQVTFESLLQGKEISEVIHPQLVMDEPPEQMKGAKTIIPVSPMVMERLFSGKTKGLAIYSQGAVNATFVSSEANEPQNRPVLYFEL
jgi:hypothetical protein